MNKIIRSILILLCLTCVSGCKFVADTISDVMLEVQQSGRDNFREGTNDWGDNTSEQLREGTDDFGDDLAN